MPKLLLVVAAALIDADGRVLVTRRPDGKELAGLWEFPGGKIEPDERPEDALVRELAGRSWHSLRAYKRLFIETQDMPLAAGLAYEAAHNPGAGPDFAARRDARLRK